MPADSPPLLLPLSDPRLDLANAGGKAASLGAMLRAGLPVPDGLVLTTTAYRAFVAHNDLEPLIVAAWDRASRGAVEAASAELRAAFAAGVVPGPLAHAVGQACAGLAVAVAVRSSATAEDLPEASFAGQQDTFLNLRGEDAVLEAVRRCWGSLWTARAMAYRQRQGIGPLDVALAVVLQQMVPASAAGVMFTVHPVTGRRDRAVLNAIWGLGEALVAGRVNPDTLVVDKTRGSVLRVDLGEKAVMTALRDGGTADAEVAHEARARCALTDTQAAALARHGVALEALFGGPQDVEWAIAEGEPVLLQSRPVTTLPPPVPGDDAWPPLDRGEPQPFDFWTRQDLGERWPEPPTPLTWSVAEPMNQEIMEGMFRGLRAPWAGRVRWSMRAHGHAYMNEGAMLHAFTHGFGMPLAMVASGLTHPGAAPKGAERWQLGRVLVHMPGFLAVPTTWEKNVRRFEEAFPQVDAWVDEFMARDLAPATDADLLREAQDTWFAGVMTTVAWHTNATSLSMSTAAELDAFVRAHGGDAELAQTLMGGIQGVIAAEMVPDLAAMTTTLREAGLAAVVVGQAPEAALATLRTEPRAETFRLQLDRFLRRHGHRCMVEAELRHPRWAEAPARVVEQLQPHLRGGLPPTADGQAARRREAATAEFRGGLGWFARLRFDRALRRAHRFTRMRDNGQSYVVKLLMPLRVLLALLGRRWADRGWLDQPDDVFFLVQEELHAVASAGSPGAGGRRSAGTRPGAPARPRALDAPVATGGAGRRAGTGTTSRVRRRRSGLAAGPPGQPGHRDRRGQGGAQPGGRRPAPARRHPGDPRHRPRVDAGLLVDRRRGARDRRDAVARSHRGSGVRPAGGGQRARVHATDPGRRADHRGRQRGPCHGRGALARAPMPELVTKMGALIRRSGKATLPG